MGRGQGRGPVQRGALYSEVQYIMGNGHMSPHLPVDRMTDWQTEITENITFPPWTDDFSLNHRNFYYIYVHVFCAYRENSGLICDNISELSSLSLNYLHIYPPVSRCLYICNKFQMDSFS